MADPIVLEHEILGRLKRVGLVIVSTGSDADGHIPIDKFKIETAALHYGTLVYLLNQDSSKESRGSGPTFWNRIRKMKEEITITQFGWEDIANAVQTLAYNNDVLDEAENNGPEITSRIIRLTIQGMNNYIKKTYLKEAIAEQRAREAEEDKKSADAQTAAMSRSVISTNKWGKIMAILTGLFTFVLALSAVIQIFRHDEISVKGLERMLGKMDSVINVKLRRDTVIIIEQFPARLRERKTIK